MNLIFSFEWLAVMTKNTGEIALNLYYLRITLTEQLLPQKIYQYRLVIVLIDFIIERNKNIGDYHFHC